MPTDERAGQDLKDTGYRSGTEVGYPRVRDAGFAGGSVSWLRERARHEENTDTLRATLKWRQSKGGGDDKAGVFYLYFRPFVGAYRCFI